MRLKTQLAWGTFLFLLICPVGQLSKWRSSEGCDWPRGPGSFLKASTSLRDLRDGEFLQGLAPRSGLEPKNRS